jgi:hypothetical protein
VRRRRTPQPGVRTNIVIISKNTNKINDVVPNRRSLAVCPAQAGLLRPVGTPLSPDQGIVFHDRLIPAEPKPFEQALRKIEFIHGRLWGICPADKNGRR